MSGWIFGRNVRSIKATGEADNEPGLNDYLLQTEYFLDKDGSAIQAFYYVGKTSLASGGFTNNLQRGDLFGTWGHIGAAFRAERGVTWGADQTSAAGSRQNSVGTVLETDLYLHNRTALFARYDGVRLGSASDIPRAMLSPPGSHIVSRGS